MSRVLSMTGLPILAALFFMLQLLSPKPAILKRSVYVAPPKEIKYLASGFRIQMADMFWLRAVQDFDFCDEVVNEKECKGQSWLFNIVDLIVELDSKFIEAYYFGGVSLSVIVADYAGATVIFDKGVAVSKDWHLLYAAGYHALYDKKDKRKASDLFLQAADNGAPEWLRLTAGRLATESGELEVAREILKKMITFESDPGWVKKLQKKIDELEKAQ